MVLGTHGQCTYINDMSTPMRRVLLGWTAAATLLGQAFLGASLCAAQETVAQDLEAGDAATVAVASATSYTPIPAGVTLDIIAAVDTELANDATDLTSGTLATRGYSVSRDADYVVDVAAVLVRGIGQDADRSSPIQGSTRGDAYSNAEKSQSDQPLTEGNLFSSNQGALFNPREQQRGGHLLRVSLSVYDRKSGLYVWRGQIERDSVEVDANSSLAQMVPALLTHFGQGLPPTEVPLTK